MRAHSENTALDIVAKLAKSDTANRNTGITSIIPRLSGGTSRVVTVYMQSGPATLNRPGPQRSYSYFTGFHMLNFADIKWDLLEGIALYAVALAIQYTAARMMAQRPAKGRSAL